MASLFNTFRVSLLERHVSMRVHGTSAQVQLDGTGSGPGRFFNVERRPQGTSIGSNYPASFSVHLSIPSPLATERTVSLLDFSSFLQPRPPVFKGTSLRVVRVEIHMTSHRAVLGTARLMDGDRQIAQADMDDLLIVVANDVYAEEHLPPTTTTYIFEVDQRLYASLGVSFQARFTDFGDLDRDSMTIVGAKAIFKTSE